MLINKFNRSFFDTNVKNKRHLIIHGAHHKAGTLYFHNIFRKLCELKGWIFETSTNGKTKPHEDTDIFLSYVSKFDFVSIGNYVGSHMIRDPRDMLISGYFYHKWCNEKWCNINKDKFNGKTYKEMLNTLPKDDGIIFEMQHSFKFNLNSMTEWNYYNPLILELRFEDMINNEEFLFSKVFEHYGLTKREIKQALKIVGRYKFEKKTGRKKGEEQTNHHLRKGIAGDWENHFSEKTRAEFKKLFPGALYKLGYEPDDNW